MPIRYHKLFDVLHRRDMRKTDLVKMAGLTAPTMAKLTKGASVTTVAIEKVCKALDVQPSDIMEYVKDNDDGFYNPVNLKHLDESIAQLKRGQGITKTIEELEEMAK